MSEKKTLQLLQLFFRETDRARLLETDALPDLDEEQHQKVNLWLENKRNFTLDEIARQHWIKTCSAGYITELLMRDDGTLEESSLFNRTKTRGHWALVDGVIEIEISKGDNRYHCAVIANKTVNIHSAIEYKNGELHSYLKLIQTRPV
ncbi:hypothetical protein [Photobacterium lipolyticum]|uniref:Uncharacterized protein n=1 Tax=Photobacterium lipolyticum TaxID=266810 RepID=A0A2T3N2I6_9GAMM|nr:hypothetical protein [Photobacterium lipolyticum]PSW06576.1 hypothetical protein C9I89_03295 [Photobacterium lipolyticum]